MSKWNILDKLIAKIRYLKISKYVIDNKVICDIGCGQNADFLKRFSTKIKKGYGLDFRIKDTAWNNIQLICNKDIQGIPLPDGSCDEVFMLAVLEHLDEPEKMICEMNRILKKDGFAVMTTPTRLAKPVLEFMAFKLHIINEDEILEHKHYYNKDECISLLEKNGFSNIKYSVFTFGMNSVIVAEKSL